jgi:hypothetical protein
MPAQKNPPFGKGPPGALARPDWKPGAEFTSADLRLEQRYNQQRIRRHLRLMHGWGVVCGLTVVSAGEDWWLFICPGYGVGPCGDEIVVPAPYRFNLRDFLWTRPMGQFTGNIAWIAIEAAEYAEDFDVTARRGCGCGSNGDEAVHATRTAEGFRVVVSWTPPILRCPGFDMCSGGAPDCPLCPEICFLPLASVSLPSFNDSILNPAINKISLGDH